MFRRRRGTGVHTAVPEADGDAVSALAAILKLDAAHAVRQVAKAPPRIAGSRLLDATVTLAGMLAEHAGTAARGEARLPLLTVSVTCLLGHCEAGKRCAYVGCGHTCHIPEVRVLPGPRQWHPA